MLISPDQPSIFSLFLFHGNDSHTNLVNECGGFNYIYYEDKDATIINFAYHIIPIARMDLSVVNCGVEYAPPPTFCFQL